MPYPTHCCQTVKPVKKTSPLRLAVAELQLDVLLIKLQRALRCVEGRLRHPRRNPAPTVANNVFFVMRVLIISDISTHLSQFVVAYVTLRGLPIARRCADTMESRKAPPAEQCFHCFVSNKM